jgi:beta-glucosidase/6-phospho-beta-glucosidase/beta-galactosidase
MRSLTNYVKDRYNSPPVYITENGKNTYKMDPDPLPFRERQRHTVICEG